MSASSSPSYPSPDGNSQGVSRDSSVLSVEELQQCATADIPEATRFQVKQWINLVKTLYTHGSEARQNGDLNKAYVAYYRGLHIMIEIIAKHPDRAETRKIPLHTRLFNFTKGEVFGIVEELDVQIRKRYEVANDSSQVEDELASALEKFPPLSELDTAIEFSASENDILNAMPTVPQQMPQARRPTPMHEPRPSPPTSMPTPPSKLSGANTGSSVSTGNASSTASAASTGNGSFASMVPLSTVTHTYNVSHSGTPPSISRVELPRPTNQTFPMALSVTPMDLLTWMKQGNNGPSILLLDVRPRQVFLQGCIRHKWICQIEPIALRPGVTSTGIEESLVLIPEKERALFEERREFDLVVYYDDDSQSIQRASDVLVTLKRAIYEFEFSKPLRNMPMLLEGGFAAWQRLVGNRGVYRFGDAPPPATHSEPARNYRTHNAHQGQQNLPWLQHVVGKGPGHTSSDLVAVHHTLYDFFSQKPLESNVTGARRHTEPQPALRGIFGQAADDASQGATDVTAMPEPHFYTSSSSHHQDTGSTKTEETLTTRYPDIRPNISTVPPKTTPVALKRRGTFIDNPFHGFTETKTNLFDGPPRPAKPTRPLPPPPFSEHGSVEPVPPRPSSAGPPGALTSAPPLPVKPSGLRLQNRQHRLNIADKYQDTLTSQSFSQLGASRIGTTGLKNLGNTCYMNSIIQCLSGTIPLARYLISGMYKQHINKVNPFGTHGVLATGFSNLLRMMWNDNSGSFLSPTEFREALIRFAPQFAGTDQQDSQEFLTFLLDGLHEDVNRVKHRPPVRDDTPEEEERFERLPDWQQSNIAWEKYIARNWSIIVSLFQGQYRSKLICLTCKRTSTTYNPFMSLSLPIPAKGKTPPSVTIYQCIDAFVKQEILEGDDAWYCSTCKKHVRASKQLTLTRLPDVLLIHLKRFSYDGPFRNKLETMVQSPTRGLDLTKYIPSSIQPETKEKQILKYDLYGISNHYGSLTGGHYTACVRNGYRKEWHYFDDTRFSICSEENVMTKAAYNLFYVRSTVN